MRQCLAGEVGVHFLRAGIEHQGELQHRVRSQCRGQSDELVHPLVALQRRQHQYVEAAVVQVLVRRGHRLLLEALGQAIVNGHRWHAGHALLYLQVLRHVDHLAGTAGNHPAQERLEQRRPDGGFVHVVDHLGTAQTGGQGGTKGQHGVNQHDRPRPHLVQQAEEQRHLRACIRQQGEPAVVEALVGKPAGAYLQLIEYTVAAAAHMQGAFGTMSL